MRECLSSPLSFIQCPNLFRQYGSLLITLLRASKSAMVGQFARARDAQSLSVGIANLARLW
jgi:hypothetical protein